MNLLATCRYAFILLSSLAVFLIASQFLDAYPLLIIFPIAAWLAILAYGLLRKPR